jgi:hypothetical protein
MASIPLTAFWITSPVPQAPLRFGVTARSLDDALRIIQALDYGRFLPEDHSTLGVRSRVTVADLDAGHVVPNMGSIAVRGLWFPFCAVGIPAWAEERLRQLQAGRRA